LSGCAIYSQIDAATSCFRTALEARKPIVIDISNITDIDPRFFGLLLMLRKRSKRLGCCLTFINATAGIKNLFRQNGFEFLLTAESRS
jgi:N-acetylglucosaminyldiphosphoundecaprenol N-acetyl-beta-D-mannosaminyltransferase